MGRAVPALSLVASLALHAVIAWAAGLYVGRSGSSRASAPAFVEGDEAVEIRLHPPPRAVRPAVRFEKAPPPELSAPISAFAPAAAPSPARETPVHPEESPPALPPLPDREEPPFLGRRGARTEAQPAVRISPVYPTRCRKLGHEGTCVLECEVDASGNVSSVRVAASAGCPDLDEAAVNALRAARFEPARDGGVPVPGRVTERLRFVLLSR